MLNKRRLSAMGWVWLSLLYVVCLLMTLYVGAIVALAVHDFAAATTAVASARIMARTADSLASVLGVWANLSIVLGVLIWSEADKLLPHEEQAWREAQRPR